MSGLALHGHPLPLPEPAPAPQRPRAGHPRRQVLWLGIHLPRLALEALGTPTEHSLSGTSSDPMDAVVESRAGLTIIYASSPKAERAGVQPGMTLATACALSPGLTTRMRDTRAEQRRLMALAAWANRFTPIVVPEPPDLLLLEVYGSLTLFGGPEALCRAVRRGLRRQGHESRLALTPTPAASRLLARLPGKTRIAQTCPDLLAALRNVPVHVAPWPEHLRRRLRQTGIRTLGDLMRLPRAGLARRFGRAFTDWLARLQGEQTEVLAPWHPPERYRRTLELPSETCQADRLHGAAENLLQDLGRWLGQRGAAVPGFTLELFHDRRPPTCLRIELRSPSHDVGCLGELLRIHLENARLPAPVTALHLRADAIQPATPREGELLSRAAETQESWTWTLQRVRARLGPGALKRLRRSGDPRPESVGSGERDFLPRAPRPLWLLRRPVPLPARGLLHGETLESENGPERIETGWWDGGDIRRDYVLARDARGLRVWLFRDLRQRRRFLHGFATQLDPPRRHHTR